MVRMVLWLGGANEHTRRASCEVIGGYVVKKEKWVRGVCDKGGSAIYTYIYIYKLCFSRHHSNSKMPCSAGDGKDRLYAMAAEEGQRPQVRRQQTIC